MPSKPKVTEVGSIFPGNLFRYSSKKKGATKGKLK
jgi:hypothetical protein